MRRFAPGGGFPSVAIDTECSLMCGHCRGQGLRHMRPMGDPGMLLDFGMRLARRGGIGILVSGGFDAKGRLRVGPFLPALRELSERTDLVINLHTGLVDEAGAAAVAEAGVDIASVDLIGSGRTIREVYHLDRRPEDYLAAAERLADAGVEVAPHITMGLHLGELLGERRAIEMAAALSPRVLIVNALMDGPVPGLRGPPLGLMRDMRDSFRGRLVLGCMYPRGADFPEAAEALGFDGAVAPGPAPLGGCCAMAARDDWMEMLGETSRRPEVPGRRGGPE